MNTNEIPFFFIVGKGRSGTTLLQTLLDANPDVLIPFESPLIIHLKNKYGGVKHRDEYNIRSFLTDLYADIMFSTLWKVDREKLKNDLLAKKGNISFAEMCRIVYLNYISPFPKQEIKIIGDKNPVYSIYIPELLKIFPNAKFIHLVRDYRDNIFSHIGVFPVKDVSFVARKWVHFNKAVEKQKQKSPSRFLTLNYEELASHPEENMKQVCSFLNIEFRKEMFDFYRKTNETAKEYRTFIEKYHKNILNPVNKNKIAVWKEKMKPEHIRIADYICGDYAKRYGYEKFSENKSVSLAMKSAFSYLKLWNWIFIMKLYFNYLPLWSRKFISAFFKIIFGKDYKRKSAIV